MFLVAQKLETYLVMQPSNTLKKLVNVGIMTNDNLSTVLDKIGNRLQIDDCILLFAIDKQNHVVNDYIIVDVKRLIRPLMSEYRMVAHLYERDQRVCTAYRYRCYGNFSFMNTEKISFSLKALTKKFQNKKIYVEKICNFIKYFFYK